MKKCKGLIGWILGHKYMGRYTTYVNNVGEINDTTSIYTGEVCVRCGHRIKRKRVVTEAE